MNRLETLKAELVSLSVQYSKLANEAGDTWEISRQIRKLTDDIKAVEKATKKAAKRD